MIQPQLRQKLLRTSGFYARRVTEIRASTTSIEIVLAAVAFHNLGDEQRPIIVSNEPLEQQTQRTRVPNRPPELHLYDEEHSWSTLLLQVQVITPGVLRLRLRPAESEAGERDFAILTPSGRTTSSMGMPLTITQEENAITITADETVIVVQRDPFALSIKNGKQQVLNTTAADRDVHGLLCTPLPGVSVREDGSQEAFWSWAIEPDEHFYGLGERFSAFDHRGRTTRLWNQDAWGTTTNASYKNVPFVLSSRHYGLFFHTPGPMTLHIGSSSARSAVAYTSEQELDLFVLSGTTPKEILTRYTTLTGRASVPPIWAFGVWLSRCRYQNRAEVEAVARRAREEELPCDVLHIDPAWLRYPNLNCDFIASEDAFPDLAGMIRRLKQQGFHISLWELPYISAQSPRYQEARQAGYLLLDRQGEPVQLDIGVPPADGFARGLVDFTNPAAYAWWQDLHRPWLQAGVDVFKADFGEGVPLEARAHNGMTGYTLRNLYALLYNQAVYEVIEQETGRAAMLWGRSGWAGIQRYPAQWGGDPRTDAWSMRSTLRGGLGFALSAPGIWSHDIGGFYGEAPTPELYIRWAQFGLLSPMARAHGTTPREPWEFGTEALTIFKRYAALRMQLQLYLYNAAWETHEQGWPLLRPLLLEFPDDPATELIDDEYMLGSQLLVAPVFSDAHEPVARTLYLPEGEWYDFWNDELLTGGRYHTRLATLDTIPLYVRAGTILPLLPPRTSTTEPLPDKVTLEVYPGTEHTTRIIWDTQGNATHVHLHQRDGRWQLAIEGERQVHWRVRWHHHMTTSMEDLGYARSTDTTF